MHRFLILGYGSIGERHASHVRSSGLGEVAGVYDVSADRRAAAEKEGFPVFESLERLLGTDADMAIVASPNELHSAQTCALLRAGKHVIVEKPAALTEKELRGMYACAGEAGRLLTVHQNRRWDSDFGAVRRVMEENLIGDVFNLESRIHGSRGIPGLWRREASHGGGMLYDWGPHLIDQALMAYGWREPETVSCTLSHVLGLPVDDGFRLELRYPGEKRAFVEVSTWSFIPLPRFYLCGSEGSACINDWREPCRVTQYTAAVDEENARTMTERDEQTTKSFLLERPAVDHDAFLQNFCAAAEGRESLCVQPAEALMVLRVIDAAFRSAALSRPVRPGEMSL